MYCKKIAASATHLVNYIFLHSYPVQQRLPAVRVRTKISYSLLYLLSWHNIIFNYAVNLEQSVSTQKLLLLLKSVTHF